MGSDGKAPGAGGAMAWPAAATGLKGLWRAQDVRIGMLRSGIQEWIM